MTEQHPDFLQYSGSTWEFDAALHDADGNPLDLTAAQIAWRLYDVRGAVKIELTLAGGGIVLVNALGGLCKITATAEQTKVLAPGAYRDEVVVTMPSGFVTTQAVGNIHVQKPGGAQAADYQDPCGALAQLRSARLALLTGQQVTRVRIEGFETQYSATNMDALDRVIALYDEACRKASGAAPRRFAIGSGARSRSY